MFYCQKCRCLIFRKYLIPRFHCSISKRENIKSRAQTTRDLYFLSVFFNPRGKLGFLDCTHAVIHFWRFIIYEPIVVVLYKDLFIVEVHYSETDLKSKINYASFTIFSSFFTLLKIHAFKKKWNGLIIEETSATFLQGGDHIVGLCIYEHRIHNV